VEQSEAMAAIDGVDVLFVGPADLSHALGVPGRFTDPTFVSAIETVAQAAGKHGKAAGILLKGSEDVPAYLDRGYTFIGLGSDGGWAGAGARSALEFARTFIG
jgi:4-hydroxy-2-oxoheptanedioate aldolase